LEIRSSADFVRMTRAALAAAGFVRHEVDGTVYFENGGPVVSPAATAETGMTASPPSTIVLVHGVNDHAGTWFLVAPVLARTHRVILPDLPGHGESAPKDGPLPISEMIAGLDRVVRASGASRDEIAPELRTTPFTLLGNSLGGWIAMLYTLAHPERVARLILEAAGGLARPINSPVIATNRDEARIILRNVHGPAFEPPEWVIEALLERATSSPMLRVTEVAEHVVDARLREITIPTTIVWGADDGVVPRSYVDALHEGIAGSALQVIEGAAHIPHMQQPERFLACLNSIF
jgi:pimeloyl-ACP methyl ester carboxylesterase